MSWKVRISDQAEKDLDYFRAYKFDLYRESYRLSKELTVNPQKGTGKPTLLRYIGPRVWSRRLGIEDRMVYEIFDRVVVIASFRSHIE